MACFLLHAVNMNSKQSQVDWKFGVLVQRGKMAGEEEEKTPLAKAEFWPEDGEDYSGSYLNFLKMWGRWEVAMEHLRAVCWKQEL